METSGSKKASWSLFAIDEHRLALGLLVLALLGGFSYLLWLIVLPNLPKTAELETSESRTRQAKDLVEKQDWDAAIRVYQSMLEDDPENGLAILQLALLRETTLAKTWQEYRRQAAAGDEVTPAILKTEALLFESATGHWRELIDHARYRRRAYESLAQLHSLRSRHLGETEEIEKAVAVLHEMFDNGYATTAGIRRMRSFEPIRSHPSYARLVKEESRNSNFSRHPMMRRQPPLGF